MAVVSTEKTQYIDARGKYALRDFCAALGACLNGRHREEIVIICIGTDRATGDCFGPIVGHMLEGTISRKKGYRLTGLEVIGTLDTPVHAKNIDDTKRRVYREGRNPLVIAVDACLGRAEHVGCIGIGCGAVRPGAGLGKVLPEIGDVFVTGVVNFGGVMGFEVLRNTRLGIVMRMSEIAHTGIIRTLSRVSPIRQHHIEHSF